MQVKRRRNALRQHARMERPAIIRKSRWDEALAAGAGVAGVAWVELPKLAARTR
jgi:hypothetical protein